jgi:hypothetical protein
MCPTNASVLITLQWGSKRLKQANKFIQRQKGEGIIYQTPEVLKIVKALTPCNLPSRMMVTTYMTT